MIRGRKARYASDFHFVDKAISKEKTPAKRTGAFELDGADRLDRITFGIKFDNVIAEFF